MYYTYIIKCLDNTYYTGSTNNLEQRLKRHNSKRGAKYTAARIPCELIYYEQFDTLKAAAGREAEIKKYSRSKKEKLIFGLNTYWQHYKGNKYTIVGITKDIIFYADSRIWHKFEGEMTISGQEMMLFARHRGQWLDWIERKTLRFKRIQDALQAAE